MLMNCWSEPHRQYHTVQHLQECLALADAWGAQLSREQKAMLDLALWFHDAIYETRSNQNEARSASLAESSLFHSGISREYAKTVARMVLATAHNTPTEPGDYLTDILLDIDLAILGAAPARFAEYERQIRSEYSWVDDETFEAGRGKVLTQFREMVFSTPQTLYRTDAGRTLVGQAQANLTQLALPDLFWDLDGVWADFYGETSRMLGADYRSLAPAVAWGRLEEVDNLFLQLPVLPHANQLWAFAQGRARQHVLTATPRPTGKLNTAPGDKLAWSRANISSTIPVFIAEHGLQKARWAKPGAILVDDLDRNIKAWEAAGGIGVLHRSVPETLERLDQLLPATSGSKSSAKR